MAVGRRGEEGGGGGGWWVAVGKRGEEGGGECSLLEGGGGGNCWLVGRSKEWAGLRLTPLPPSSRSELTPPYPYLPPPPFPPDDFDALL